MNEQHCSVRWWFAWVIVFCQARNDNNNTVKFDTERIILLVILIRRTWHTRRTIHALVRHMNPARLRSGQPRDESPAVDMDASLSRSFSPIIYYYDCKSKNAEKATKKLNNHLSLLRILPGMTLENTLGVFTRNSHSGRCLFSFWPYVRSVVLSVYVFLLSSHVLEESGSPNKSWFQNPESTIIAVKLTNHIPLGRFLRSDRWRDGHPAVVQLLILRWHRLIILWLQRCFLWVAIYLQRFLSLWHLTPCCNPALHTFFFSSAPFSTISFPSDLLVGTQIFPTQCYRFPGIQVSVQPGSRQKILLIKICEI